MNHDRFASGRTVVITDRKLAYLRWVSAHEQAGKPVDRTSPGVKFSWVARALFTDGLLQERSDDGRGSRIVLTMGGSVAIARGRIGALVMP